MRLGAVVLDSADPAALAAFYQKMLKWAECHDDGEYVYLSDAASGVRLIFQEDADYQKPAWPATQAQQQQMMHLDFYADDLEKAVKHAIGCGAELAETQYSDFWRVMLDPAGHPFCIVRMA